MCARRFRSGAAPVIIIKAPLNARPQAPQTADEIFMSMNDIFKMIKSKHNFVRAWLGYNENLAKFSFNENQDVREDIRKKYDFNGELLEIFSVIANILSINGIITFQFTTSIFLFFGASPSDFLRSACPRVAVSRCGVSISGKTPSSTA
jgi:hypothetical protein